MLSLIEVGPLVLEKKMVGFFFFKFSVFSLRYCFPLSEGDVTSFNLYSIFSMVICSKVIFCRVVREKPKILKVYGQTNGRRTIRKVYLSCQLKRAKTEEKTSKYPFSYPVDAIYGMSAEHVRLFSCMYVFLYLQLFVVKS
jgi:hypothetical protein